MASGVVKHKFDSCVTVQWEFLPQLGQEFNHAFTRGSLLALNEQWTPSEVFTDGSHHCNTLTTVLVQHELDRIFVPAPRLAVPYPHVERSGVEIDH